MSGAMRKLALIGIAVVGAGLVGCGGDGGVDEGPSATEGTPNLAAMRSAAMTADRLRAAVQMSNGAGVAGAAIALSNAAMGAVSPKRATQPLTAALTQPLTTDAPAGNVNCDATGCKFDGYTVGGFSISGAVTTADAGNGVSHVTWSLNGKASNAAVPASSGVSNLNVSYKFRGDLRVSPATVSGAAGGTADSTGTVQGMSFDATQGNLTKLLDVQIMDGCPVAGSVFAKWWLSASAGAQSQSQAYQATQPMSGCR